MQPLTGETGRDDPQFQKMLRLIQNVPAGEDGGATDFMEIEKLLDRPHNVSMSEPINRPELDAKLETIEAKMDGRLLRMEAIAERISEDVRETRRDIKTLKTTVITTAIIAALTIVFGIAGFNAMLTSNMLSAFQAGQQVSQQK